MKGLIRKRSTTAARLQRAFSAKGLRTAENNNNNNATTTTNSSGNKDFSYGSSNSQGYNDSTSNENLNSGRSKESKPKRQFIMETPVQFTAVRILTFFPSHTW